MKILLAEDDFASRKFMTNYLEKYGECDITVDGEEAVDAFMIIPMLSFIISRKKTSG